MKYEICFFIYIVIAELFFDKDKGDAASSSSSSASSPTIRNIFNRPPYLVFNSQSIMNSFLTRASMEGGRDENVNKGELSSSSSSSSSLPNCSSSSSSNSLWLNNPTVLTRLSPSRESEIQVIEWNMMDMNKFYPLSMISSFFIRCVLYPLTLVKTKIQVSNNKCCFYYY